MSPWSAASGAAIILISLLAWYAVGMVYSEAQARDLISSLSNSGLYLASAMATASASTLALMLTLIGLTHNADSKFDDGVYRGISRVSILSTGSLIGAVLLLLMLVAPVGEFDKMPSRWYPIYYNCLFAMVGALCAALVTTVMELFLTIRRVIRRITPGDAI